MTNDQVIKSGANMLLFPVIVFLFCVGLFLIYDFGQKEIISRKLASFSEVVADDYTLSRDLRKSLVAYTYTVDGISYGSTSFSPYPSLNKQAEWSSQIRALTTRVKDNNLIVYYDPDDPSQSSILRAWPREGRLGGLPMGGIIVWVGCLALSRFVQKSPRHDLLFKQEE